MRHSNFQCYDEFIPKGVDSAGEAVFTAAQNNAQLARHNQLGFHAVVDNITPSASTDPQHLYCFVETSADGKNWIQRSDQTNAFDGGAAELQIPIVDGTLAQRFWTDACQGVTGAGPLLGFVRLRMFFSTSDISAHVRIHAAQRDE